MNMNDTRDARRPNNFLMKFWISFVPGKFLLEILFNFKFNGKIHRF
jgi:hypothetical protein